MSPDQTGLITKVLQYQRQASRLACCIPWHANIPAFLLPSQSELCQRHHICVTNMCTWAELEAWSLTPLITDYCIDLFEYWSQCVIVTYSPATATSLKTGCCALRFTACTPDSPSRLIPRKHGTAILISFGSPVPQQALRPSQCSTGQEEVPALPCVSQGLGLRFLSLSVLHTQSFPHFSSNFFHKYFLLVKFLLILSSLDMLGDLYTRTFYNYN